MRILHVIPSYLPAVRYGGPVASSHELCKALAALGHQVTVFTTNADGPGVLPVPVARPVDLDGVQVWYFPLSFPRRLFRAPRMVPALREAASRFDVFHLHSTFLWPNLAATRILRGAGKPYILSPRGALVEGLVRRKSRLVKALWIRMVEESNLRWAAAVHFTSSWEEDQARAMGLPTPGAFVLPNGAAPCPLSPLAGGSPGGEGRPELLFLGRLSWEKGIERLIRALPAVPGASLLLAGEGESRYVAGLARLAADSGVSSRVRFLGHVGGEEKEALWRRASLLVLASLSENFGNVALEAMARGVPVAATRSVGASEVVAREAAGILLPEDPAALGARLAAALARPGELRAMGARGRAAVEARYAWPGIAARMAEAYRRAIDRAGGPDGRRAEGEGVS